MSQNNELEDKEFLTYLSECCHIDVSVYRCQSERMKSDIRFGFSVWKEREHRAELARKIEPWDDCSENLYELVRLFFSRRG